MRRAIVAALCLGLLAVVSARDISAPKPIVGTPACLLPISRLTCIRDWRSGFVAGVKYGYNEFSGTGSKSIQRTPVENWMQVCSTGSGLNQTVYEMSVASQIQNSIVSGAQWYTAGSTVDEYLYESGAPITQVIVLQAPNPFGDKFGTIPAILFGYQTGEGDGMEWAVCGNIVYARAYLRPGEFDAPPTIPTLKATYTSGISDESEVITALGGFDAKCSMRGSGFLGGDPHTSSKYFIKHLKKPCFAPANATIFTAVSSTTPLVRVNSTFSCIDADPDNPNDADCFRMCSYNKKQSKTSASFSCVMNGLAVATGKYSVIDFNPTEGTTFEMQPNAAGSLQRVKGATLYEGEASDE